MINHVSSLKASQIQLKKRYLKNVIDEFISIVGNAVDLRYASEGVTVLHFSTVSMTLCQLRRSDAETNE